MTPALETLLLPFEHGELAVPQRALFLGAEPHPAFKSWPSITGWQPFKPSAAAWDAAGFARTEHPAGSWPLVLVLPGKSKDETLALFARAHDLLEDGGILLAAMPNTAGAARFEKELSRAASGITATSKHKCRAFHAARNDGWNHGLLEEWRALGAETTIPGTHFTTCAGIFSPDHIDAGSQFLAKHLPHSIRGKVADLGAGWGFLSHHLLAHCTGIQQLDLFEADARALALAQRNLTDPSKARCHWHDVATGLGESGYDAIVMNPPFHTGQATDVGLGKAFLRAAADGLKRGGQLFIVANRQLPYESELDALNLRWRKSAEDATFKLLFASK